MDFSPIKILTDAQRAVPAVRYAAGISGVAAVVAIIAGFQIDFRIAVFGTILVLGLMFVLVTFSALAAHAGAALVSLALFAAWCFVLLTVATSCLLMTSYFFAYPRSLESFIPDKLVCEFDDILKSSAAIPVFVPGESSATITHLSGNNLSVTFKNRSNGSGVAFRLTPMAELKGCRILELSGTSTEAFSFLVEYKIEQVSGLMIAQQSAPQVFPQAFGTYTAEIPLDLGKSFSHPASEIVLNFLQVGESSHLRIESLKLI